MYDHDTWMELASRVTRGLMNGLTREFAGAEVVVVQGFECTNGEVN